jgi:hypothetical protein
MKVITPKTVHGCYDVFHVNGITYVLFPGHTSAVVDNSTEAICPHGHTRIYSVNSFEVTINGDKVTPSEYDIPSGKFALSTMEKDCSRFMFHWLTYHKKLGVDFFFIYDNNSSDEEFERIVEVTKDFDGLLVRWNYPFVHGSCTQTGQQNHSVYLSKNKINRIGLTDLDEYIVLYGESRLDSLLREKVSYLWWVLFGKGDVVSLDPRDYHMCKGYHEESYMHKMIVDPDYVTMVAVHGVVLPTPPDTKCVYIEYAMLHHYMGLNPQVRNCVQPHSSCILCRKYNIELLKQY